MSLLFGPQSQNLYTVLDELCITYIIRVILMRAR